MPHMQDDFPLNLSTLYDRAVWLYPDQEIVSVESDLPDESSHGHATLCSCQVPKTTSSAEVTSPIVT